MSDTPISLDDYWADLVTAALLGSDRRDPPDPPRGPVADAVADVVASGPAARMLTAVATVSAARRGGFVPGPAVAPLQGPDVDLRPYCSAAAVASWRVVVSEWPIVEDEWVLTVIEQGWRLAPDVLVELLIRHRGDAVRSARVALAAGPMASWLVDLVPALAPSSTRSVSADAVAGLPELPVPPELADLLGTDAHTFVTRLLPGFEQHAYGAPHRAVLANLLARCRREVLVDAADALARVNTGIAIALSDLARVRERMLSELDRQP